MRARSEARWRLWAGPALGILLAGLAGLGWAWLGDLPQRQDHVLRTVIVVGLTLIAELVWLAVWLFFLSRVRLRTALGLCLAAAAAGACAVALLRFEGVSGDVLPRLGWRWQRQPGELPAAHAVGKLHSEEMPLSAEPATPTLDHPQFLGIDRDGTVRGPRLSDDWAARPPELLWRQPIGAGWSGFAVVGERALTMEQRGAHELVSCYDAVSGALLWSDAEPVRFEDLAGGAGPRATPSIHRGRVYAVGGTGLLRALELSTGQRLWSADLVRDAAGELPQYGVSSSPLVIDGVVYAAAGRGGATLLAYDAELGRRLWAAGTDEPGEFYSSPQGVVLDGVPQIVLFNGGHLAAHDPATGGLLWRRPWPGATQHVSQPIQVAEDRVFLSTGYGVGGRLFEVQRADDGSWTANVVWESIAMKAKFSNVVHREGYLYGLDDGILACVDLASGRRQWKGGRYGHGQILRVGDRLIVTAENGEVALVEASPQGWRELGRLAAIEGKAWAHPAFAGGRLFLRNDREAACYELPLAD